MTTILFRKSVAMFKLVIDKRVAWFLFDYLFFLNKYSSKHENKIIHVWKVALFLYIPENTHSDTRAEHKFGFLDNMWFNFRNPHFLDKSVHLLRIVTQIYRTFFVGLQKQAIFTKIKIVYLLEIFFIWVVNGFLFSPQGQTTKNHWGKPLLRCERKKQG